MVLARSARTDNIHAPEYSFDMAPTSPLDNITVAPPRTQDMQDDEQYFVEAILAERVAKAGKRKAGKRNAGKPEYLIKWEGYPPEQNTWVSGDDVSDDWIATWEAQKRQQEDSEMELDNDDQSESDDEDIVVRPKRSRTLKSSVSGQEVDGTMSETNVDADHPMTDADQQVSDTSVGLEPSELTIAAVSDEEDEEDEEPCNEHFFQDEAIAHNQGHACEDPRHTGRPTVTCEICIQEAVNSLNEAQQDAYENGALFPLCAACAKEHTDEDHPDLYRECKCLANASVSRSRSA